VGEQLQPIPLQECRRCKRRWQSTFSGCPYCGATDLGPHTAEGRGVVYSWVEVCRSLEDPPVEVPYTVVCVDLDAGARVLGRYGPGGAPEAGASVIARGVAGEAPTFEPLPQELS
jgi:uncharacterized OB-fold protein